MEKNNWNFWVDKGGTFTDIIALSPEIIGGSGWSEHVEDFHSRLSSVKGARIPGERRHKNRLDTGPREINTNLVNSIKSLL